MASSRKPQAEAGTPGVDALVGRWLREKARGRRILVAVSGGLDSIVLLDALARACPPGQLHVGHVDHALQDPSPRWASFVEDAAARRGLGVTVHRLASAPSAGASLEAWARTERYAALVRIARAQGCELIACAHHADDRIESLLLALGRGAGPRGLAAMRAAHAGPRGVYRPLLTLPRAALEAQARRRALEHIDDPSNADGRFARNLLRMRALPALEAALPGFRKGALRAIAHLEQMQDLLDEITNDALLGLVDERGELDVAGLLARPAPRPALVLRAWLAEHDVRMPSTVRLADWLRQLAEPATPPLRLPWGAVWLCRYRDRLWIEREPVAPAQPALCWQWQGERQLDLPASDAVLRVLDNGAVAARWLRAQRLRVRAPRAGDRLRPLVAGASRSLKNLWQERGIPPWLRPALPVVEAGGRLVYATALGWDSSVPAAAGETGVDLRLVPRTPGDPRWRVL